MHPHPVEHPVVFLTQTCQLYIHCIALEKENSSILNTVFQQANQKPVLWRFFKPKAPDVFAPLDQILGKTILKPINPHWSFLLSSNGWLLRCLDQGYTSGDYHNTGSKVHTKPTPYHSSLIVLNSPNGLRFLWRFKYGVLNELKCS